MAEGGGSDKSDNNSENLANRGLNGNARDENEEHHPFSLNVDVVASSIKNLHQNERYFEEPSDQESLPPSRLSERIVPHDSHNEGQGEHSREAQVPSRHFLDNSHQSEQQHYEGPSEQPRENPLSFKHFLNPGNISSGGSLSFNQQGARPKVFSLAAASSSPTSPNSCLNPPETPPARVTPELTSALPDFVQDHLILEQWYLGESDDSHLAVDLETLPDFTCRSTNASRWNEPVRSNERVCEAPLVPLDLPGARIPPGNFPLDLPTDPQGRGDRITVQESGVSSSLPDFLSDGAVHSQPSDNNNGQQSPEREIERLRTELDSTRNILSHKTRQIELLQRELNLAKLREEAYLTQTAMRTDVVKKLETAEEVIHSLRSEIKTLCLELNALRKENRSLKNGDEAAGNASNFITVTPSSQLLQEIRLASENAEMSLRQSLSSLDSLRTLTMALESQHENKIDFLPPDEDEAGPAL